jgi:hypothetical protein
LPTANVGSVGIVRRRPLALDVELLSASSPERFNKSLRPALVVFSTLQSEILFGMIIQELRM